MGAFSTARASVANLVATCLLVWTAWGTPVRVRAQGSRPDEGRGLSWGASFGAPIVLGAVADAAGRPLGLLEPGGGAEGRIGYELPGGLALGLVAGVFAHASSTTRALTSYRGALEARWTIETGTVVAPTLAAGLGVDLEQFERGLAATGYGRLWVGTQWLLDSWFSLDLGATLEASIPGDAFRDAVAWVCPQIGVTFHE